jgi:hypothetical protein
MGACANVVVVSDEIKRTESKMAEEAEGLAGGPGIVATKSQAKGSLIGVLLGGLVGAVLGLGVGLIFFSGTIGIVICVVAFAAAGLTAGGMAGGFVKPRKKLQKTDADT